jgi:hypothetical protein
VFHDATARAVQLVDHLRFGRAAGADGVAAPPGRLLLADGRVLGVVFSI